jgi:hypothetical protein
VFCGSIHIYFVGNKRYNLIKNKDEKINAELVAGIENGKHDDNEIVKI